MQLLMHVLQSAVTNLAFTIDFGKASFVFHVLPSFHFQSLFFAS